MMRGPMVVSAAAALVCAGPSAVGHGEPNSACTYTLSPPRVVQLSGINVVMAKLSPAACDRSITYLSVACIQLQGSSGPGQCAQGDGILPAQVFYQPYRPGATYVSTGRGCATTGNPPQPVCQPAGPLTVTL